LLARVARKLMRKPVRHSGGGSVGEGGKEGRQYLAAHATLSTNKSSGSSGPRGALCADFATNSIHPCGMTDEGLLFIGVKGSGLRFRV
jgi:hypothetical protein